MIEIFVINGVDYFLFVIGGVGALVIFIIQLALCFKTKKTGVKLIPAYFILFLIVVAILSATGGNTGFFIDLSGFVAKVILCVALIFGIAIGAAWLIFKTKMNHNF